MAWESITRIPKSLYADFERVTVEEAQKILESHVKNVSIVWRPDGEDYCLIKRGE